MTTYDLLAGLTGPSSPAGAGTGAFLAGTAVTASVNGLWLTGYTFFVPAGGDVSPQKFALWQLTTTEHSVTQALAPAGTLTSGTLTAGATNFVPFATPIGWSGSVPYVLATGWTVVNGFPITSNEFGNGQPLSGGIAVGPISAYSDTSGSNPIPSSTALNQGLFSSTLGADPAAAMPQTGFQSSLFWVGARWSDVPPAGATFALWPNQPYPRDWVVDTADNFTLGTEFSLSIPCPLRGIPFYSPPGVTQLPTECGIWDIGTQTLIAGSHQTSPSWKNSSGSAASPGDGWVETAYDGSLRLPAGRPLKTSVFNGAGSPAVWNGTTLQYWTAGPGGSGIVNGPLRAPNLANAQSPGQSSYHLGATFAYPDTFAGGIGGAVYWTDVRVGQPTATPGGLIASGIV